MHAMEMSSVMCSDCRLNWMPVRRSWNRWRWVITLLSNFWWHHGLYWLSVALPHQTGKLFLFWPFPLYCPRRLCRMVFDGLCELLCLQMNLYNREQQLESLEVRSTRTDACSGLGCKSYVGADKAQLLYINFRWLKDCTHTWPCELVRDWWFCYMLHSSTWYCWLWDAAILLFWVWGHFVSSLVTTCHNMLWFDCRSMCKQLLLC